MEKLKKMIRGKGLTLLGILLGLAGGFLYWRFVGCSSGTCPISSSPWMSTLWGGALGGLLFNMFKVEKK